MNRFALVMMAGFVALLGLSAAVYSFQKCGAKAFLFGNGALYAAASGACEEN
jgi:hypothetical protein